MRSSYIIGPRAKRIEYLEPDDIAKLSIYR